MIEEVIQNITAAESEAEEMLKIAARRAKDIRLNAEYEREQIMKNAAAEGKRAARLRSGNAEIAAKKKAVRLEREGNAATAVFIEKCRKNVPAAAEAVAGRLIGKYVDR